MKRVFLLIALNFLAVTVASAAKVDSIDVYSPSMERSIRCLVVTPDEMPSQEMPSIYFLHGYSGNYKTWVTNYDTKQLVDDYKFIAILPDGDFNSWYLDSPFNPKVQFETFISHELVEWIDHNYPTIDSPKARAITGFSMGGHGALYNALRHQDVFGAVGSMSGGVDIRPFPHRWDIASQIGTKAEHPENWEKYSVINQLHWLDPSKPIAMIIDCGSEDFFYDVNNALHEKLLYLKYPHRYISDEGVHNAEYWKKAQHYHVLFFDMFFDQQ